MILLLFAILGYGAAGVLGVFTVKEWSSDVLKAVDLNLVRDIRRDLAATTVSNEGIKSLKIITTTSFNITCTYVTTQYQSTACVHTVHVHVCTICT